MPAIIASTTIPPTVAPAMAPPDTGEPIDIPLVAEVVADVFDITELDVVTNSDCTAALAHGAGVLELASTARIDEDAVYTVDEET